MSDLLDEIYDYLERPQRYSHYIACLCSFHNDTRPSMFIYPNTYHCSACGASGKTSNLLNDLKRKQGVFIAKKRQDFHSPWSEWERRYGSLDHVLDQAHRNLISHNKTVYLTKRGIDLKTIKELKIGYLDEWITFPVYDVNEETIGGIARAGESNKAEAKYCNYPGMSAELLFVPSWKMIEYSNKVILVYGIIDAISLYQLGYASASTTTGKRVDPCAFDNIRKNILIIPDHGEEVDAAYLSARLSWRGKVLKVDWPEGEKDCNDLFLRHKDLLVAILEGQHGDNTPISK